MSYPYGHQSLQPPYSGQNQQYPPPQQPYPQQPGYGQYQQPYQQPPPNQGYQQGPPPVPYGSHPTGGSSSYPPQHGQYPPPQGHWQQPPQQHSPYPPQQAPYGAPPPPPHGYPPQAQSYGPPTRPSLGYDPNQIAHVDTTADAQGLRSAMKGFGTDESRLIQILSRVPDPVIMATLRRTYDERLRRNLLNDISSETSGYFKEGLEALVRGPLQQDVHNLIDAIKGVGTKENVLNDVLLARSNADIRAIKQEYQRVTRRSLESDVSGDLSMKTERLFTMVLAAQRQEESAPVLPQDLERSVSDLHHAMEGRVGKDQVTVCQILSSHSDGQLRAIAQEFQRKYHKPLATVIRQQFSGHMEDALLRMLKAAEDRAMADAQALEETMKGAGTKDRLLVNRLARIHWDRNHMNQVKGAYRHAFKKELSARVKSETSSHYQLLMLALIDP